MDPFALACIAIAAVLHAAWNILLKTAGDPLRTATVGVVAASLVLVPLAAVGVAGRRPARGARRPRGSIGIVSGGVEVAYFVFLAAAYRRSDLSVVYPLARGSAPLLAVAIGVVVLGERLPPRRRGWASACCSRGCSSSSGRGGCWGRPGARPGGGRVRAPHGGDDRNLLVARPRRGPAGPGLALRRRSCGPPAPWGSWSWPGYGRGSPAGAYAPPDVPLDVPKAVAGGLLTFTAYGFVLAALSRAPLSIVAPLRESAVLLTSTWGVLRLREAVGRREIGMRIAGSVLVLAGAVVLADRALMRQSCPRTRRSPMPALTLGYKASAEQFPPQRLLDLAVAAEAAGFDSVWTSDHFQPWRHTDGHAPNALVWLGAASQATSRVTLGTSVLTPSFRYNPAIVAQAFATLGCLAPGRVILGVGTGESLNEVPVGVDLAGAGRALRPPEGVRAADPAALARRAARPSRASTTGRTTPRSTTARTSPCPIYIAASGPAAARLAGRIARRVHLHQRQGRGAVHRRRCCRPWPRAPRRPAGTPGRSTG